MIYEDDFDAFGLQVQVRLLSEFIFCHYLIEWMPLECYLHQIFQSLTHFFYISITFINMYRLKFFKLQA